MATDVNDELNIEHETRSTESCRTENEEVTARKVKSAVKEIVTNDFSTLADESLDDMLKTSFYNGKRGIQLVVYNVVEQVMLGCYVVT